MFDRAVDLDSPVTYTRLDPSNMRQHLSSLPQQCREAWHSAMMLDMPSCALSIRRVVVAGMGGSAIAGDLIRAFAAEETKIPITVHRGYGLPAFVDGNSLVIVSSYSGMTEETVSAFLHATRIKARVLVITRGGKLGEMARERGVPFFHLDCDAPPRAVIGYLMFSLIAILQRLSLIGDKSSEVKETAQNLASHCMGLGEESPLASNQAKQLAQRLLGHMPVIYGAGFLTEVAHRWKTQFNENSKTWAFYEEIPELNHNSVVGYTFPLSMSKEALVLLLRSPTLPSNILARYQVTSELLSRAGVEHVVLDAEKEPTLLQMMKLIVLGDYVSYYLALLNCTDPTPVEPIDYLKSRLSATS